MADFDLTAYLDTQEADPDNYEPAVKAQAYELYMNSDCTPTEIAVQLAIPEKLARSWVRRGKWRERKDEILTEFMQQADDRYRQVLARHRVPVVERHLRVSQKLEELIEQTIASKGDGPVNEMSLKRLAEALASVTGVSARAAAVNDRALDPVPVLQGTGKVPLVAIGINVTPAHDVRVHETPDG